MEMPAVKGRRRFTIAAQAATRTPQLTVPLMVELLRRADNERLAELDALRQKHSAEIADQKRQDRVSQARAELDPATREKLELLAELETALGITLSRYTFTGDRKAGREHASPKIFAVAITDLREGIRAADRLERLEHIRSGIVRNLTVTLKTLESEK